MVFLDLRNLKKCQIFRPKYFFEIWTMVLGVLKTYKKIMENEILRSINPFLKTLFFSNQKRTFFQKFRVKKWPKYVILSCGIKKRFGSEKGAEYITTISIVSRFGGNLTWWNFQFCGHLGLFMPFFRGRKAKNAWKISVTSAWTPPKYNQKNFRPY